MIDILTELLQSSNPLFIIISGLMIGLLHAFEPDHLSSISTQLTHSTKRHDSKKLALKSLTITSSLRGAIWGVGHTSSIILIGLLIAGLSLNLPNNFFISAEVIVGFMLIILGIFTITNKSIFKQKHTHPHVHSNEISHTHSHDHSTNHKHSHKSYLIGCIHGVAGSGSLVALVSSTMNSFDMMIYFLILFGIGSILGMTIASGILGLPFILLSKIKSATKYLRYAVSGVTFVIGLNILFSIGLNNEVFSFN